MVSLIEKINHKFNSVDPEIRAMIWDVVKPTVMFMSALVFIIVAGAARYTFL